MARLAPVVAVGIPHHVTQRGNARRFILDTPRLRAVCPHGSGALLPGRNGCRWKAQMQACRPRGTACSSNCRGAYHAPGLDLPSMKFRWMYRTTPNSISAKTNTPNIVTGITISKTVPNPCRGIPMSSRHRAGSPQKRATLPNRCRNVFLEDF